MNTTRPLSGARLARVAVATAAAGTMTFFLGMAAAQADDSSSAAPNGSAAVPAQPQVTVVNTGTATASASSSCPATVAIVLGSISVSGNQVTVSFTHTGTECPDAASSVLHVHENLLSTPHAGSDPVHQSNRDFTIGPDSANSVTVALLDGVEGKCFVQVDVHAGGVNRGQFFPTETCPSASPSQSVSPSQSTSPSQVVNPPTPPAPRRRTRWCSERACCSPARCCWRPASPAAAGGPACGQRAPCWSAAGTERCFPGRR